MEEGQRRCFHCGVQGTPESRFCVEYAGVAQACCCAGCQAAAQLVLAQGLGRYYEFRSGEGKAPDASERDWAAFDREASVRRWTHLAADGSRSVSLQLEGIHCAACSWLIDNSLRQLSGVLAISVNAAGARAELRYDPNRIALGQILRRIGELGYLARPLSFTAADDEGGRERRMALLRLAVAGFGMMQVMTFAVSLYAGALQGMDQNLAQLMRLVSLIVATPVVLFAAQPFFLGAVHSLRARTLGMDVPVALSIGAAYLWSAWATLVAGGPVYFDSAVMFTFLLLLGRYIEMSLRHRCGLQQHALARLLPDSVLRLRGAQSERVMPDELLVGDRLRVLPGERIAADGVVEQGRGEVDESLITGESVPQVRGVGGQLTAGTLNLSAPLEYRVERVGPDSTLATVSRLLQKAQADRPRFADQADRVAAWFVGAMLLLALCVGVYWLGVEPARAFPIMLAVLVVTCPCALSLATPAALAAATTRLARTGLLITRGRALERLAVADRVVFDKTGTLTRGQVRIEDVHLLDSSWSRERALAISAALERYSKHPIAQAFAQIAGPTVVTNIETDTGRGVGGTIDGVPYRIGRWEYALELSGGSVEPPSEGAQMLIALANPHGVLATFSLADGLREDAAAATSSLHHLGLTAIIASGDRAGVVTSVAQRLGDIESYCALDARAKVCLVSNLQGLGHTVLMVGDGVNDAPVLAAADVSIAIGGGTDLAKVSADLVLMGEHLAPIAEGIDVARRTRRIIRQNLLWAVIYNTTAVPLAAAGLLQPWMAAIGMSMSSLLVVLNAMRLLRGSKPRLSEEQSGAAAEPERLGGATA